MGNLVCWGILGPLVNFNPVESPMAPIASQFPHKRMFTKPSQWFIIARLPVNFLEELNEESFI